MDEVIVATGHLPTGESWKLASSASGDSVFTTLHITRHGTSVYSGTLGGPPVTGDSPLRVCWGREENVLGLIIRAAAQVRRVVVGLNAMETVELPLHDIPDCPFARVTTFGHVLNDDVSVSVAALSHNGEILDVFSVPQFRLPISEEFGGDDWAQR